MGRTTYIHTDREIEEIDRLIDQRNRLRTYIARLEGIIGLLPGEDGDTNPQRLARAFRETILQEGDRG